MPFVSDRCIDTSIWITLWNINQTFYMNGVSEVIFYIKSLKDRTNSGHLVGSPLNRNKSNGDWFLSTSFQFSIAQQDRCYFLPRNLFRLSSSVCRLSFVELPTYFFDKLLVEDSPFWHVFAFTAAFSLFWLKKMDSNVKNGFYAREFWFDLRFSVLFWSIILYKTIILFHDFNILKHFVSLKLFSNH